MQRFESLNRQEKYHETVLPCLVSSRLVVAMAGCLLAGAAFAAAPQAEPPDVPGSQFTSLENGIPHPTVGCDGAVVLTPRPGTQFADPLQGTSGAVTSFYAKAARAHVTWASTLDCMNTGITHQLVPAGPDAPVSEGPNPDSITYKMSQNWSGYQIGNTAQYVQGGWTIPTVVNPPLRYRYSTTGYYSSTWTGIGGGIGVLDPLIQAGSYQLLSANGVATYYFWWEIVGGTSDTNGKMMFVNTPTAHPGDSVGSAAIWQSSGDVELSVCDFTDAPATNYCVQMKLHCVTTDPTKCTPLPGKSVEWIVEAPYSPLRGILPLADFGVVEFSNNCWASTYTSGDPINCEPIDVSGLTSPINISLYQNVFGCNQTLAIPSSVGAGPSSAFEDVYQLPDPTCNK